MQKVEVQILKVKEIIFVSRVMLVGRLLERMFLNRFRNFGL
jgi:hypothetical protein